MEQYLVPRKVALFFLCGVIFLSLIHFSGFAAADRVAGLIPFFCPFEKLTGIPCPGCGMTRAVVAVSKGELIQSIHFHPFVVFLFFIVTLSTIPRRHLQKVPSAVIGVFQYCMYGVLVMLIAHWILFRLVPHFH